MIEIRGLKKSFNRDAVLNGIELDVKKGETLVVIGRSGGGKTLLLKHIIGLMRPDAGSIRIAGRDITTLPERELDQIRLKFGMLFQDAALFDSMNVFQNVAFALGEHTQFDTTEIKARVEECLNLVGLKGIETMWPDELSGGMKKRVGLARALAIRPEIMLYDEPTSGVDPLMSDEINTLICQLSDQLSVTSVVVTHDIEGAFAVGDRIALLENGLIVTQGTPQEFRKNGHPLVREFLNQGMKTQWEV
ncbi:ABC transporter ATP-binding protein [Candidatus Acetothermia bacterium]|nr:ABC transporter ATP-binding protein [Candidatus Acetothermia bacterium]MBI3643635.1 ABC transporter ATP-binding protein [Candidatus Acetothermia bacterium]